MSNEKIQVIGLIFVAFGIALKCIIVLRQVIEKSETENKNDIFEENFWKTIKLYCWTKVNVR